MHRVFSFPLTIKVRVVTRSYKMSDTVGMCPGIDGAEVRCHVVDGAEEKVVWF